MTAADDRHRSAARSNYESTANIEKRQRLQASISGFEGTPPQVLLSQVQQGDRVVDVGCGNGLWSAQLEQAGSVLGLDPSFAMAAAASEAATMPTVQGDALHLPFAAGAVDAVLMFWMLYHVPEKAEADSLAEVIGSPVEHLLERDLPWDEILTIAASGFADEIDRRGAIEFERRGAGFVATRGSSGSRAV